MAKSYIALIADAIASRDLAPTARARLQADARAAVKDLNHRYRRVLAARFAITLGDELQCLLATPQPLWDLAHDPPAAPHRHPAAAGRPGGRGGPARRRSQRDLPPRPPHGLAPRGRRG